MTRATELSAEERFADALKLLCDTIAQAPGDAGLRWARGGVLFLWGRNREAAAEFKSAAGLGDADFPSQHIQRGWANTYSGNLAAGLESMQRALAADPSADANFALGYVLHLAQEMPAALTHLDRCLELDPERIHACIVAGLSQLHCKEPQAALRYFERAVEIDPNSAPAWTNLSIALEALDRDDEALAGYEQAARIERETGEWVGGLTNFAIAVGQTGRVEEAIRLMESDERPPRSYRQYVRGLALVSAGRLAEGWPFHEFRWACEPLVRERPQLAMPRWCGQDLAGKRIVIRAEQGYGDTLQFLRYAPWLKRMGATVYVRVQEGFEPEGLSFDGVDRILVGAELVQADFFIPCMSLPGVFGTELESIPLPIPYVHVREDVADRWSRRIPKAGKLRVGVVWAGNPAHQRDRHRSIPLAALAPLFAIPGVAFYSLQKGPAESEIPGSSFAEHLENLAPDLTSYADTAAAIANLDLVICVDTSVAHLAGAVGCPTWVLIPKPADWRWMLDRRNNPWYPSIRLFRQRERRQWAPVIDAVAEALRDLRDEHAQASGGKWACDLARLPMDTALPTVVPPLDDGTRNTTRLAETRYGLLEYLPDEPLVGRSVAYYGEYAQLLLVDILRLLPRGSTVVEVGAGVGTHTLGLETQVGDEGHVIAFEHRLRHRQALEQNLTYNRLRNVTLLKRPPRGAVSIVEGAATDSIDDLQLDALACIKIGDGVHVEEVLGGAEATLWRLRPVVFVTTPSDSASLAERVRGFGYRTWRIHRPLFSPDNFNRWRDDVFPGASVDALIAVPEELDIETAGRNWVALD